MQRLWEGGKLRDEMEERYKELSSIAMLARRDIDRYLWLSEYRPDLAQFAPGPPGRQVLAESKIRKKKNSVDGSKPIRKGYYSNRCMDNLVRSGGRELSDLPRFFSKLDVDLQKRLLDAIATDATKKDLVQEVVVQKDGREPTLAWLKSDDEARLSEDHQPRQLRRSCTVPKAHPTEEKVPCSFRQWKQVSKQQNSYDEEKFNTERENSLGESTPNSSCRLTNSSGRLKGGCGKMDSQDEGVCRDAAIQTRRSLRKSPKPSHKARDHTWDVTKSLADHASQTSTRPEHIATKPLEEDIDNLREQATVYALERWAEPLEQYLSTLQKFEQELREKWLSPEELETVPNPETQRGNLESICVQHASDFMRVPETQMQMPRMSPHEVEAQPDEPIVNRTFGGGPGDDLTSGPQLTRYGGIEHLLDKSKQEKFATREPEVKSGRKKPELWPPDKHFHRTRSARSERTEMSQSSAMANSLASRPKNPSRDPDSHRGKSKQEYLDAGFRTRKLVEWWPSDKPVNTTKYRSAVSNFSSRPQLIVYNPKTLLVLGSKAKREQIPADNLGVKARKKPEWWPALRRPYSASEVKLMRQKEEEAEKATRTSPSKIVTGYLKRPHSQSSYKSQRSKTDETEITRNPSTSASLSQHGDDSMRRTLQKRTASAAPAVARLPRSHQKSKEHQQEVDVSQEAHEHCQTMDRPHHMSFLAELERQKQLYARKSPQKADEKCQKMERPCNVGAVGELEELNDRKLHKSRTGHYALQTPKCSNSNEPIDQCGQSGRSKVQMQRTTSITNTGEDQVCEFITIVQPEHDHELQVTSSLLRQIKTRREADVQADIKSQETVQREFRVATVVAPVVDLHNREHEVEMARKERQKTNCIVQQGVERLADKLIDQAVKEVASELAEFVETVAEQMYMAEFMT